MSDQTVKGVDGRHVHAVSEVFRAINEQRWDDVVAAYSPDGVIEYPQSGERIEGRDHIRAMMAAFPTPPVFVVRHAFGGADNSVIIEFDAVYSGVDPWKGVALYWLSEAGIDREVAYFGEPFAPPQWRLGLGDER